MTSLPSSAVVPTKPPGVGMAKRVVWFRSLILGLGTASVFLVNGREISSWDTVSASLIPLAIMRGDGLNLDRFVPLLRVWGTPLPPFVTLSRKHVISRYPVAPALAALPIVAPQIWVLDRMEPGWDRDLGRGHAETRMMAKRAAAIMTALVAVALYHVLAGLGLEREGPVAVVATLLGSELWSVASQSLWQHGPAALALTLSLWLLGNLHLSRTRAFLAGLSTGAMVLFRSLDLNFALVILAWMACQRPRRLVWFLPGPMMLGLVLLTYNLYFFDDLMGGQAQLERLHVQIHGVGGPWSGEFTEGLAGTLLSPSRGLLVYCPWVAVAVGLAPWSCRKLAPRSLVRWLLLSLVPMLFLLSKYAVWWAGGTFGPRYWTEAFPLLGVLLACGLSWARDRSPVLKWLLGVMILFSIGVQAIGAFCYPSTWNFYPSDIDLDHTRLWDWRDTEISRCLIESWTGRVPVLIPGR